MTVAYSRHLLRQRHLRPRSRVSPHRIIAGAAAATIAARVAVAATAQSVAASVAVRVRVKSRANFSQASRKVSARRKIAHASRATRPVTRAAPKRATTVVTRAAMQGVKINPVSTRQRPTPKRRLLLPTPKPARQITPHVHHVSHKHHAPHSKPDRLSKKAKVAAVVVVAAVVAIVLKVASALIVRHVMRLRARCCRPNRLLQWAARSR